VTLTIELDLDNVRMNQCAKYLGQRSFYFKVILTHSHTQSGKHTHTHTHSGLTAFLGSLKCR